jgi:dynein heavy chain
VLTVDLYSLSAPFPSLFTGAPNAPKQAAKEEEGGLTKALEELMERLPVEFNMVEVQERAEAKLKTEDAPFVLVAMQECTNMNALLFEIRRGLDELQKGQNGELNMTEPMEDLATALTLNQVPGRNPMHKCSWEKLAWWSKKTLMPWFEDMLKRSVLLELLLPLLRSNS